MVLMNDWSARDIQIWETVPLGPFTGKNWVGPYFTTLFGHTPSCLSEPSAHSLLRVKVNVVQKFRRATCMM